MPEGFDIDPDQTVQVSKNGRIVQMLLYMEEEDSYKVKIYNAGLEILFG